MSEEKTENLWQQLIAAINENDANEVVRLIKNGAAGDVADDAVNIYRNGENMTLMEWAAAKGHLDVVKSLHKRYVKANGTANEPKSIIEGAKAFLQKMVTHDKNLRVPIFYASQEGHADIIKFLAEKNTNVNIWTTAKWTPLHYAAKNGHLDAVKSLVNQKANVNALTIYRWSPLLLAAEYNHPGVAKFLIESDADISVIIRDITLMNWAAHYGHLDIVESLVRKNVNVNHTGNEQRAAGYKQLGLNKCQS